MKGIIKRWLFLRKPTSDDTYWPVYSRRDPDYFILNAEKRGIGRGPRATACAFWNELMPLLHQGEQQLFYQSNSSNWSNQVIQSVPSIQSTHFLMLIYESMNANRSQLSRYQVQQSIDFQSSFLTSGTSKTSQTASFL